MHINRFIILLNIMSNDIRVKAAFTKNYIFRMSFSCTKLGLHKALGSGRIWHYRLLVMCFRISSNIHNSRAFHLPFMDFADPSSLQFFPRSRFSKLTRAVVIDKVLNI